MAIQIIQEEQFKVVEIAINDCRDLSGDKLLAQKDFPSPLKQMLITHTK